MVENAPVVSASLLDDLANRGWPALETCAVEGWLLRAAHGVTRRANSVLPCGEVDDLNAAIDAVEAEYRARGIRPAFQLSPASRPRGLAARLELRGYTEEADTLVMVASTERVISSASAHAKPEQTAVLLAAEPSTDWLDLWWSVDGRGGDAECEVARRILTGGAALYASSHNETGPVAVGRLALVNGWGGLYSLATRPDSRRRGHARHLIGTLALQALRSGAKHLWLQVVAENEKAVALYRHLGFEVASGYSYWVAPHEAAASE
jgi:ribosomal protein S18 acetylase RimI-like enzyme